MWLWSREMILPDPVLCTRGYSYLFTKVYYYYYHSPPPPLPKKNPPLVTLYHQHGIVLHIFRRSELYNSTLLVISATISQQPPIHNKSSKLLSVTGQHICKWTDTCRRVFCKLFEWLLHVEPQFIAWWINLIWGSIEFKCVYSAGLCRSVHPHRQLLRDDCYVRM